jgi:MFS family permease
MTACSAAQAPKLNPPPPIWRLRPEWLNNDLLYLFAGRGLRSLAQGFLIIIVPLYVSAIGFDAEHLGIMFAASAVSSAVMVAAIGLMADRFGRKTLLIAISAMMAGGGVVFATSTNFLVLVTGAALGTIGRGGGAGSGGSWGPYLPAEQAMIAEHSSAETRTHVFGTLSSIGVVASAAGSLLASAPALLERLGFASELAGYRLLFALTAVLGIGMVLVTLPISEAHHRSLHTDTVTPSDPAPRDGAHRRIMGVKLSHDSWQLIGRFMLTNSINGLAVGMLGPFIVYWFHRRYGVGAGVLGTLFFIANLMAAAPSLIAGLVARRFGAVTTVVVWRIVSAILLFALAVAPAFALAATIFMIRTFCNTLSLTVRQSYLMGVIKPSERASAAGLANFPAQGASAVSPYFAGFMMEHLALSLPLEIAAGLMMLNSTLYYIFFRNVRPPEEKVSEREDG